MRIDYFRISDIAGRTGISEERVADFTSTFEEFFTWAAEGEERYYTPDALLIVETIDAWSRQGKSDEEIRDALDRRYPQLRQQKEMAAKETECSGDER